MGVEIERNDTKCLASGLVQCRTLKRNIGNQTIYAPPKAHAETIQHARYFMSTLFILLVLNVDTQHDSENLTVSFSWSATHLSMHSDVVRVACQFSSIFAEVAVKTGLFGLPAFSRPLKPFNPA